MIKNPDILRQFEDRLAAAEGPLPYAQAMEIVTALWREGVALGVLPPADPWEGLDGDLRLARVLKTCLKNSSPD